MTPEAATGVALADQVRDQWAKWLLVQRRPPKAHPDVVYASGWRACTRRMFYDVTVPDQVVPFDAETLARFQRGEDRERDLLITMSHIGHAQRPGFAIVAQQFPVALDGRRRRQVIRGYIDGLLRPEGDHRGGIPLEVKTWSTNIVERLSSFDDVIENPWTQSGAYQLLAYLLGHNVPFGYLVLDRSGIPKLVVVELTDVNLQRMETFLARAEAVLDHVEAGTVPDFIDDPAECARCPYFGTACHPPLAAQATQVLTDPDLEATLERWWALREAGREWRGLDDQVKQQLRGVESGVAGHFAISGRWGKQTRLDLPDDLKRQYTVADPKGRFTLDIARL